MAKRTPKHPSRPARRPASENPVTVYLARLSSEHSRRAMALLLQRALMICPGHFTTLFALGSRLEDTRRNVRKLLDATRTGVFCLIPGDLFRGDEDPNPNR